MSVLPRRGQSSSKTLVFTLADMSVADPDAQLHLSGNHRHTEGMMTEEKQQPEKDEVSEEELEGVSGGVMQPVVKMKIATPSTNPDEEEEEELQT